LKAKHVTEFAVVDQHLKRQQEQEVSAKKRSLSGSKTTETKPLPDMFQPQTSGSNWTKDHPKQKLITDKITRMICRDIQPFSVLEDKGFRDVIKTAEPRYVMPSRKTFTNELIPQLYSETVAAVKSDMSNAVCIAVTTDGWTSRANNSYLSYTAHFLTENFEPRNYCLNVENVDESHTAQNLANSLSQCIGTWTSEGQRRGLMKLYVVADNAANIQAAINKLPQCKSLSCFAHTLQLVVNGAIKNCSDIETAVSKSKSITTYFKHNVQSTQKLLTLEKSSSD
jgi:hypothetical protein